MHSTSEDVRKVRMLLHWKSNLLKKGLHPDGGSFRFNSITKHDYNVFATSSTLLESSTHHSDSDSDVSDYYDSLIFKPKHLCRKLSLNVKPVVLSRKSTNDRSSNESTKHSFKSIVPPFYDAAQN